MKKAILFVLIALFAIFSFSSCSEDPRVAPTKIFIVNVDENGRQIEYDPEIGYRVVFIRLGEEYKVDAVTNRVPTGAKLTWRSDAPGTVSIDENGLCRGLKLDSWARISVSVDGGRETAVCMIKVVRDPDHIPVEGEGEASLEIIKPEDLGGFMVVNDGNFCIFAEEDEISSKKLTLNWIHSNDRADATQYRWYIDGSNVPLEGYDSPKETFTFKSYGFHNITCEALVSIEGMQPYTSTISIFVRILPESVRDKYLNGEI